VSGLHRATDAHELVDDGLDGGHLLRIAERAAGRERFIGLVDSRLVGEQQGADVAEDGIRADREPMDVPRDERGRL